MPRVSIAMVFNDSAHHTTDNYRQLVDRLRMYIGKAFPGQQPNGQELRIFMAPEFYFRKSSRNRFYSKKEKEKIIEAIQGILHQNNRMLLVAGSVLWSEHRFARSNLVKNTAIVFYGNELVYEHDKTQWGGETSGGRLVNRVSAPNARKMVVGKKKFLGFKISSKYKYKLTGQGGVFSIPNELTAAPARIGIGIEICMEHEVGVLRNTIGQGQPPWLHLVTANTVTYRQGNEVLSDSGIFCRCSAGEAGNSTMTVGRKVAGAFSDVTETARTAVIRPAEYRAHLAARAGNRPRDVVIAKYSINNVSP